MPRSQPSKLAAVFTSITAGRAGEMCGSHIDGVIVYVIFYVWLIASHQSHLLKTQIRSPYFFFFSFIYLFIFRQRRREGERKGEKHQCVFASCTFPTGDLARNPGVCPDWESTSDPLVHRPALNPLSHIS